MKCSVSFLTFKTKLFSGHSGGVQSQSGQQRLPASPPEVRQSRLASLHPLHLHLDQAEGQTHRGGRQPAGVATRRHSGAVSQRGGGDVLSGHQQPRPLETLRGPLRVHRHLPLRATVKNV